MVDITMFATEIAAIVSEEVERATSPLVREIESLKARPAPEVDMTRVERLVSEMVARAVAALPPPPEPAQVDMAEVERLVGDRVERAVAALPPPPEPAQVDMAEIERLVGDRVERAVSALPPPPEAAQVDIVEVERLVVEQVDRAVGSLPPPPAPAEVDMAEVERLVGERVERAVSALPPPPEPAQVDMAEVERMVGERVERAVSALPPPPAPAEVDMAEVERLVRDRVDRAVAALPPAEQGIPGVGLAGAMIDRAGNLIITLSNGELKDLGPVVGREGFSLENFDTKWDGERTLTLSFSDGRQEYSHQLHMPIVIYRDVYAEGQQYEPGDAVTWGGSLWIAQRSTSAKPDSTDSGWKLSVKRGRDGKDKTS